MRRFDGTSLIIATHNKGKLDEFQTLLSPYVSKIVSSGDLDLPEPVEDGHTFLDNAKIKALTAAKLSGEICLADDSGLCITALKGAPGLFSARWAGATKEMSVAWERVRREMGDTKDKSAYFIACLVLAWPDGHTEHVEARCLGEISFPPRGEHGHGYDPIFLPEGKTKTFAELTKDEKNAISHRGRALRLLVEKHFA